MQERSVFRAVGISLEFYLFAGLVYFLLNFLIEQSGRFIERRISIPG